jgi:hypothetical protein
MVWRTTLITKEIDLTYWKSELAGTANWLAHWHDSGGSRLAKYVILFPIHHNQSRKVEVGIKLGDCESWKFQASRLVYKSYREGNFQRKLVDMKGISETVLE